MMALSGLGSRLKHPVTVAHVLPLLLFILCNALPGMVAVENRVLPWWRFAPEHWVYPIQSLLVGALLLWGWRYYQFAPWRGLRLATALGAVGIALWLMPAWLYVRLTGAGFSVATWWEWFGIAPREDGFDPTIFDPTSTSYVLTVGLRFFRMVVIVPLAEEIFWRGFLMRYLQADGGSFLKVPFGRHDWKTYSMVTTLFMLAHHPLDWAGALIFGSLMYWVACRTKSLAACVLMHAVANLLLGCYVMYTRQWGFW